jgi:hypothetical protein
MTSRAGSVDVQVGWFKPGDGDESPRVCSIEAARLNGWHAHAAENGWQPVYVKEDQ